MECERKRKRAKEREKNEEQAILVLVKVRKETLWLLKHYSVVGCCCSYAALTEANELTKAWNHRI